MITSPYVLPGRGTLYAFEPEGCCQSVDPDEGNYGRPTSCTSCDENRDCTGQGELCIGRMPSPAPSPGVAGWPAHPRQGRLRFQPIVHRGSDPEADDDVAIYVGSDTSRGGLTAFNGDGEEIWIWDQESSEFDQEPGAYPLGGVLSPDGDVLYANGDDWILALNLEGGSSVQPGARTDADVSLKWRYEAARKPFGRQTPVLASPTSDLGIYQAHRDPGGVHKIEASCHLDWRFGVTGTISWSTPARGPVFSGRTNPRIVFGSHKTHGCLFAVEDGTSETGDEDVEKIWDFRPTVKAADFFTTGAMSEDSELLYMGTNDGVFYALDAATACSGGNCTSADNRARIKWCYDTRDEADPTKDCWPDVPAPTPAPTSNGCSLGTPHPDGEYPCCTCPDDLFGCRPASSAAPCPTPTP